MIMDATVPRPHGKQTDQDLIRVDSLVIDFHYSFMRAIVNFRGLAHSFRENSG